MSDHCFTYTVLLENILAELPFIEIITVNTSMCSASVRWLSSRNDACGFLTYDVQLLNNDNVLRNLMTNATLKQLSNLVPSTNYPIAIKAMYHAAIGMTKKDKFSTAIIPQTGMCVLARECIHAP